VYYATTVKLWPQTLQQFMQQTTSSLSAGNIDVVN